jgi:hypothetical protein
MTMLNIFRALTGVFFAFSVVLLFTYFGDAAEHPGKSTTEHPGKAISADSVKEAIKSHVENQEKAHGGVFTIEDAKLNKTWKLKLAKIHDPVRTFEQGGKTIYFACSDFNSTEGKDVLDIDFWMTPKDGMLSVTETKIHKVNGEPRFTYEGTTIKEVK